MDGRRERASPTLAVGRRGAVRDGLVPSRLEFVKSASGLHGDEFADYAAKTGRAATARLRRLYGCPFDPVLANSDGPMLWTEAGTAG